MVYTQPQNQKSSHPEFLPLESWPWRICTALDHNDNKIAWLMRSSGSWTSRDTDTAVCLWPLALTVLLQKRSSTPEPHFIDDPSCPGAWGLLSLSALPEYWSSIWYIQRKCQIILRWPPGNLMSISQCLEMRVDILLQFHPEEAVKTSCIKWLEPCHQGPPACHLLHMFSCTLPQSQVLLIY